MLMAPYSMDGHKQAFIKNRAEKRMMGYQFDFMILSTSYRLGEPD